MARSKNLSALCLAREAAQRLAPRLCGRPLVLEWLPKHEAGICYARLMVALDGSWVCLAHGVLSEEDTVLGVVPDAGHGT